MCGGSHCSRWLITVRMAATAVEPPCRVVGRRETRLWCGGKRGCGAAAAGSGAAMGSGIGRRGICFGRVGLWRWGLCSTIGDPQYDLQGSDHLCSDPPGRW